MLFSVVLISTYWNVKDNMFESTAISTCVLISTYWNVKPEQSA